MTGRRVGFNLEIALVLVRRWSAIPMGIPGVLGTIQRLIPASWRFPRLLYPSFGHIPSLKVHTVHPRYALAFVTCVACARSSVMDSYYSVRWKDGQDVL